MTQDCFCAPGTHIAHKFVAALNQFESLLIILLLLFIKSTVFCIAHFILLHILLFMFSYYIFFYLYLYIFSCVVLHILHCPLSGPDLIYISLTIIFCIIEYVTNKKTLNLELKN